jgi:hypothetical protein
MYSRRSLLCRAAGGDHSINLTAHGESQQPLAESSAWFADSNPFWFGVVC